MKSFRWREGAILLLENSLFYFIRAPKDQVMDKPCNELQIPMQPHDKNKVLNFFHHYLRGIDVYALPFSIALGKVRN